MKYHSVFDIIGPVMIGPSSSHTAGAARIGRAARSIFGKMPKKAKITLYGSFANTHKGHGTDTAIVGGLLDFDTYDNRIIDSLIIAKDFGMEIEFIISNEETEHPNTARLYIEDENDRLEIVGVSIGGGKINITEIDGFKIKISGNSHSIIVIHDDRHGVIASVSNILGLNEINIGYMEVARKGKGSLALMVMETDQPISQSLFQQIEALPNIRRVAGIKIS